MSELKKEQIEAEGWKYMTMGAEGPYFDKGGYRTQIIYQTEDSPSVHNLNHKIKGLQNLHVFTIDGFETIYFGYCPSISKFRLICKLLGV